MREQNFVPSEFKFEFKFKFSSQILQLSKKSKEREKKVGRKWESLMNDSNIH